MTLATSGSVGGAMCRRSSTWRSGRAGRGDDLGVEGVADRQAQRLVAARLKEVDRRFDGGACAANHALAEAVDVGRYDVAVDLGQRRFDLVEWGLHGGHPAVVAHADAGHFAAAGGGGFQGVGKGHDAGGDQGRIFAERMAHDHVRSKPNCARSASMAMSMVSIAGWVISVCSRSELGRVHGRAVVAVDKNVAGQRPAEDGGHHRVGVVEDLV